MRILSFIRRYVHAVHDVSYRSQAIGVFAATGGRHAVAQQISSCHRSIEDWRISYERIAFWYGQRGRT